MLKSFTSISQFCLFILLVIGVPFSSGFADESDGHSKMEEHRSAREILHRLAEGVEKFTLSNGLRVLLFRRTQAPVFAAQIWVKVGGVNEVPGKTGLSHMLEHMAFKGTKTIGTKDYQQEKELLTKYDSLMAEAQQGVDVNTRLKEVEEKLRSLWIDNDYSAIYQQRGAVGINAGTSKDYTFYVVSLPNTEFELWSWMESTRLLEPVFRQFYQEREVVLEERRTRVDDNPSGKLYESFMSLAFWSHPNRLPVIGWASDVAALSRQDLKDLYKTYYRPDNMVISLVGDLKRAEIEPVLQKYFGRIPEVDESLPQVVTEEPSQKGERRAVVNFDAEPRVLIGFHKPVYPNPDDMYFSVMHSLLSDGRSSMLYSELVQKKSLATSIYTSEGPGELYPSLFYVSAVPSKGVTPERLTGEIQAILDRLKSEEVSDADLKAAKKRVRADLLSLLSSNEGLSNSLGHAELLWGNWEVLFDMYDLVLATSKEDIQRLAREYFKISNRSVAILERDAAE